MPHGSLGMPTIYLIKNYSQYAITPFLPNIWQATLTTTCFLITWFHLWGGILVLYALSFGTVRARLWEQACDIMSDTIGNSPPDAALRVVYQELASHILCKCACFYNAFVSIPIPWRCVFYWFLGKYLVGNWLNEQEVCIYWYVCSLTRSWRF